MPDTRPGDDTGGGSLQSVDRTVAILKVLGTPVPKALSVVAQETGLTEATAGRYLNALVTHGFVVRDQESKRYLLGPALPALAGSMYAGKDPVSLALPAMERLLGEFTETVNLGLRRGGELVVVHALESSHSIRKGAMIGERDHWHASALGKAILATLPEYEVREVLAAGPMTALTEHTLTEPDEFLAHCDLVRQRGYATDADESEIGLRCVAAPIARPGGAARFALSVSGPSHRLDPERIEQIGRVIRDEARAVATAMASVVDTRPADEG
ncbi:IclR family transcriptional regulator [Phytoactinopolyspora limicola]|uniref:IclR family transcriptional regulator n=1 Tax=Phytoactinopolyspora limicola TaxID=2715536 RepID=UPI001407699B|nr:IclR family transcriptional regulator [Phytoactinopolyspora limicola]